MGKKCGRCKGKGIIGVINDKGKVVGITCDRCGGTGKK